MTPLERFQTWFVNQCDGDWEHDAGIAISTLDNPGWDIEVELNGTSLVGQLFTTVEWEKSEHDWLYVTVTGSKFRIACGPKNLEEALTIFCDWAGV